MVQWELDSFYLKFKNFLHAEKYATLTFKSEAGRGFVTLSFDLGHVLMGHDQLPPSGHRNGPARQRQREKHAAARNEKLSAENVEVEIEAEGEEVEENLSTAEEATRVETAVKANELSDLQKKTAETVEVLVKDLEVETTVKANELSDLEKKTTEKVEVLGKDLEDEVCPDEVYQSHSRKMISVETQTLECEVAHTAVSKSVFDYYTLHYDDDDDDS